MTRWFGVVLMAVVVGIGCSDDDSPMSDGSIASDSNVGDGASAVDATSVVDGATASDAAEIPSCGDFDQATCDWKSYCEPGCSGSCDCTCPGPEGYEGCGCGGCPEQCFTFSMCVDIGCPDEGDPAVSYVSHDPLACAVIDFDCFPNAYGFSDECGCGCIETAISPDA